MRIVTEKAINPYKQKFKAKIYNPPRKQKQYLETKFNHMEIKAR